MIDSPTHGCPFIHDNETALRTMTDTLFRDISETYFYKRLRKISFLGIIDHYNKLNSEYYIQFSRSEHSKGVYKLANILINRCNFSSSEISLIKSAALCHDMGHSAFSHSLEHALKEINPSLSHHQIMERILTNDETDISIVLDFHNINRDRLLKICKGDSGEPLSWIFHAPINIDTLDGIARFFRSFRLVTPFDPELCTKYLAKLHMGEFLNDYEVTALDNFWISKKSFYESFLSSGAFAAYEAGFIQSVLSNFSSASEEEYFIDERELIYRIGNDNFGKLGTKKKFKPRSTFAIDYQCALRNINDLNIRYRRVKL